MSTPKQTVEPIGLTRGNLLALPDGAWVLVDRDLTQILDAIHDYRAPRPAHSDRGFWWRRKQLLDQMEAR